MWFAASRWGLLARPNIANTPLIYYFVHPDILVKAVFVPRLGQTPKPEIQEKIIYLIAYAVTVNDSEAKDVGGAYM
jgi:hypothetical protein